ncbi:hypothetical protein GKQ38_01285 [Candidatus Nanohaloarchaea archaeon]|nr:hypothetical protein GKQ38_01285 [Candidatus Nanohaloarchaea archaeon]
MDDGDWEILIDLYKGRDPNADVEEINRLSQRGLLRAVALADVDEEGNSTIQFPDGIDLSKEGFQIVSEELSRRNDQFLQFSLVIFTILYATTAFFNTYPILSSQNKLILGSVFLAGGLAYLINIPPISRFLRRKIKL